jgi:hypothetical protein
LTHRLNRMNEEIILIEEKTYYEKATYEINNGRLYFRKIRIFRI